MAITIAVVSRTSTSITVEARHTDGAATRIYFDYFSGGQWLNSGYELTSVNVYRQFTFTGFTPSTFYSLRARSVNGNNLQQISEATTFGNTLADDGGGGGGPDPDPPNPPDDLSTPTGFSGLATSATEVLLSWNSVNGANAYLIDMRSPGSEGYYTESTSIYIGNLQGNTTYTFVVRAFNDNSGAYSDYSSIVTVTTPSSRPSDFSWDFSKNSGGNFYVSANEWNALCNRVNDFRQYRNLGNYSFTNANSGSLFTASMYNEVRNSIDPIVNSIPPFRSTGDIINASDLNHLVSSLNNIT